MQRLAVRSIPALAAGLFAGLLVAGPTSSPAHAAESYSAPLQTAISALPVATEVRTGYTRDKFRLWVDADGDGCDTRKEVLIAEADDPVTVGSGCSLSGGRWFSYYDRVSWTDSGRIDIDHVVPLAEAWDSGARNWTATQRQSYANDLGDYRTLVGVTDYGQPVQGRPGPGRVDADVRQVPVHPRVGGGEDPLAAQRRLRREDRSPEPVVRLHQLDDHGHPRDLTVVRRISPARP